MSSVVIGASYSLTVRNTDEGLSLVVMEGMRELGVVGPGCDLTIERPKVGEGIVFYWHDDNCELSVQ